MARQSRPKPDGPPRNKGGRPRLIDQPCPAAPGQTYAEAIIELVRLGNPLVYAARSSGISEDTLGEWKARGRGTDKRDDPDGRFAQFARDVDMAEAASVVRLVLALREAVTGDPYEVTRTVTKHVRDQDGRIVPVTEQTVTRGVRRYPRTAEWLLARRAPEFFGPRMALEPSESDIGDDVPAEVIAAAQREVAAYIAGVEDGSAVSRARDVPSAGAETVPEG
jgi:hypothetical protein